MDDENAKTEQKATSRGFLDVINDNIKKIGVLIGGILLLYTQIDSLLDLLPKELDFREGKVAAVQHTKPKDCFKEVEMKAPETVSPSEWHKMKLRLKGRNECGEKLIVRVKFEQKKAIEKDKGPFVIEPPSGNDVWDKYTLGVGEVNKKIHPPTLTALAEKFGVVTISIQWNLQTITEEWISAEWVDITVKDDINSQAAVRIPELTTVKFEGNKVSGPFFLAQENSLKG